ncbi:hypothetical protein SNEBB_007415 [Seison nebaliae]|nr:hypothetical protein SNEBB_007415 [Seison nebaliae]
MNWNYFQLFLFHLFYLETNQQSSNPTTCRNAVYDIDIIVFVEKKSNLMSNVINDVWEEIQMLFQQRHRQHVAPQIMNIEQYEKIYHNVRFIHSVTLVPHLKIIDVSSFTEIIQLVNSWKTYHERLKKQMKNEKDRLEEDSSTKLTALIPTKYAIDITFIIFHLFPTDFFSSTFLTEYEEHLEFVQSSAQYFSIPYFLIDPYLLMYPLYQRLQYNNKESDCSSFFHIISERIWSHFHTNVKSIRQVVETVVTSILNWKMESIATAIPSMTLFTYPLATTVTNRIENVSFVFENTEYFQHIANELLLAPEEHLRTLHRHYPLYRISLKPILSESDGQYKKPKLDWKPVFKHLKKDYVTRFVILCSQSSIRHVLDEAQKADTLNGAYSFVILNTFLQPENLMNMRLLNITAANITFIQPNYDRSKFRRIYQTNFTSEYFKYLNTKQRLYEYSNNEHIIVKELPEIMLDMLRKIKNEIVSTSCQRLYYSNAKCSIFNEYNHQMRKRINSIPITQVFGEETKLQFDIYQPVENKKFSKIAVWNLTKKEECSRSPSTCQAKGFLYSTHYSTSYLISHTDRVEETDIDESGDTVKVVRKPLQGRHLKVITMLEEPYLSRTNSTDSKHLYEGYCVDLLNALSEELGFEWEISTTKDNHYGVDLGNGEWTGIVGELLAKRADLAVAAFTITYERSKVIDFTKPFLNTGITILYKKPKKPQPRLFFFLEPLSLEVWLYMIVGYITVSIVLFVLARFSPHEWHEPFPCKHSYREESDKIHQLQHHHQHHQHHQQQQQQQQYNYNKNLNILLTPLEQQQQQQQNDRQRQFGAENGQEKKNIFYKMNNETNDSLSINSDEDGIQQNNFTILNSLWFTIGSLMQQNSSELNPKSLSTRLLTSVWWMFMLIMISSYTANLAAFLTSKRLRWPIENADDLSKQNEINYGCLKGGSTYSFFKESKIPTFERMWATMQAKKENFVHNYKEGIHRVHNSNYAFLLESTMTSFYVERQCSLMQVGGLLDSKGYGIGTVKASPYRDILSDTILQLQERGDLQLFYNKWWRVKGAKCSSTNLYHDIKEDDDDTNSSKIDKYSTVGRKSTAYYRNQQDATLAEQSLGFENVGGIYIVLGCGLSIAIVMTCIELWWKTKKLRAKNYSSTFIQLSSINNNNNNNNLNNNNNNNNNNNINNNNNNNNNLINHHHINENNLLEYQKNENELKEKKMKKKKKNRSQSQLVRTSQKYLLNSSIESYTSNETINSSKNRPSKYYGMTNKRKAFEKIPKEKYEKNLKENPVHRHPSSRQTPIHGNRFGKKLGKLSIKSSLRPPPPPPPPRPTSQLSLTINHLNDNRIQWMKYFKSHLTCSIRRRFSHVGVIPHPIPSLKIPPRPLLIQHPSHLPSYPINYHHMPITYSTRRRIRSSSSITNAIASTRSINHFDQPHCYTTNI